MSLLFDVLTIYRSFTSFLCFFILFLSLSDCRRNELMLASDVSHEAPENTTPRPTWFFHTITTICHYRNNYSTSVDKKLNYCHLVIELITTYRRLLLELLSLFDLQALAHSYGAVWSLSSSKSNKTITLTGISLVNTLYYDRCLLLFFVIYPT